MPRPEQFKVIQQLRAERVALDAELMQATLDTERAKRERDQLLASGADRETLARAGEQLNQAAARYRLAREERLGALTRLAAQSAAAAADQRRAAALFEGLEGYLPIALMPVRLETRYAANASALQIRIYPDAVNIQRHTEGLTAAEQNAGRAYWQAQWDARPEQAEDESEEQWRMRQQRPQALWAEMVRALRAPRAAFVVRVMRPANATLLDQPGAPADPPAFPEDVETASRLSAQPIAVMLPDRFCAVGYARNGEVVFRKFGTVVPDVLAMSPVIEPGDAKPPAQTAAPFSGEAAWLADYASAEKLGMAISIRPADILLRGYALAEGLERLVVFGIDWTLTPEDAAAGIGGLLDAHAATGGLAFLPIGTPTNNTSAESAGHSPAFDRDGTQTAAPATTPADGTRAIDALRTAFGMTEASFAGEHVAKAELDETTLASHMANALYRGLAGNYLEHYWTRAEGHAASDATLSAIREHAVRFVRPAGPLQPLRIDTQPYAILPVVATARYQPSSGFEGGLRDLLALLRPSWQSAVNGVTRFDGTAAATNTLLRQGPWAQSVSYREVKEETLGSAVQDAVGQFQSGVRFTPGGFFLKALTITQGAQTNTAALLAALAVSKLVLQPDPNVLPRSLAWVQADKEIKTREAAANALLPEDANYIRDLGKALDEKRDIKGAAAQLRSASSLLAGLLAYSVDQEADQAAALLLRQVLHARAPQNQSLRLRVPMTVGIETAVEDEQSFIVQHAAQLTQVRIPQVTGDISVTAQAVKQAAAVARNNEVRIAQWHEQIDLSAIDAWRQPAARHTHDLATVRASLAFLEQRTVGELNWAFRTTLDMFDWRLDAWITSLATRRLAELRVSKDEAGQAQRVPGIHVGAWGFVEGLKPDPPNNRESLGHMLMPSMRHAAAAAILRSGYLSNDAAARAAFDLDLSSRRVRAATAIYEGLAQGQAIAALLGYRFERGLRDGLLGEFILDYRRRYPLRPVALNAQGNASDQPVESVAARDVVDGVKLIESGPPVLNVVPAGQRPAVQALLDDLKNVWDAVADLSIAEATFQIAQGNVERAAAALAVLDKQSMPVEAQVARSPRDGVTYTQRVALLLDADAAQPQGWPWDSTAAAEPRLNAWLAELIGDPQRFVVQGRAFVGDVLENEVLKLSPADLGVSPMALLQALDAPGAGRSDVRTGAHDALTAPDPNKPQVAELSRLRLVVAERFNQIATEKFGSQAFVHIEEKPASAAERGLVHFEILLGMARRLVTRARPAMRHDLAVIEGKFDRDNAEGDYPGVDAAELDARAISAADAFITLANNLIAALPAAANAPLNAPVIEAALMALRPYGVLGAEQEWHRSFTSIESKNEALRGRAMTAGNDVKVRLTRITDQRAAALAPGTKLAAIVQAGIDTLKTIFGKDFAVLPLFTMDVAAGEVNASLAAQQGLTAGDASVIAGWLPKMAKVREGVDHLQSLLLAREMLVGAYDDGRFGVLQSPAKVNAVWAALPGAWPDAPGDDITQSDILQSARQRPQLAIALHAPAGLPQTISGDTRLAALICDDWAETVPLHTSTAAIAFHYDAPGARPPQTILLAVPPRKDMANWTFDDVLATVNETIELAKLRAVCPAQLSGAVNLALPMNMIQDAQTPLVPGFNVKGLATTAYLNASSAGVKVLARGKV